MFMMIAIGRRLRAEHGGVVVSDTARTRRFSWFTDFDGTLRNLEAPGRPFLLNPRGNNEEGLSGDRYNCFLDHDTWCNYVTAAGFSRVRHYYRPPGLPRHKQWWLATVWRKG
jgi:hypothetical protein